MARSLTIKHTEKPQTSSLFNAFLLLAFGWLVVSVLVAGAHAETVQGEVPAADVFFE